MLVYSAGSLGVDRMARMADESGQNNFLFTFANGGARDCARYFCKQPHRNLVIDSGAFSVWNKDETINLDEYIAFCRKVQKDAKCPVTFMSLDVIAGSRSEGLIPTPEQSEAACRAGWEHYQTMQAAGIPAVPTFHEFDHPDWLSRMLNETDYIAVSSRKSGVSNELKVEWLGKVFAQIGIDTKVHGLGVSGAEAMESFPFYSIDSRAWIQCSKGTFRYFDGRRVKQLSPDKWQNPSDEHIWDDGTDVISEARREYRPPGPGGNFHFMMRALEADVRLEQLLNLLWQQRGTRLPLASPAIGESYHLDQVDILYREASVAGSWRRVAEARGMDSDYVQWAFKLGSETADWQAYTRGEIPFELLADYLGWLSWNGQLSLREYFGLRHYLYLLS